MLYDKYDYKFQHKEYTQKFETTVYNNGALGLQKLKHLEDYYYFVLIKFKI